MGWRCFSKVYKTIGMKSSPGYGYGSSASRFSSENSTAARFDQTRAGSQTAISSQKQYGLAFTTTMSENAMAYHGSLVFQRSVKTVPDQVGSKDMKESSLDRDYFVRFWVSDKRAKQQTEKRMNFRKRNNFGRVVHDDQIPIQSLAERWISGGSVQEKSPYGGQVQQQPPPSQSTTGLLKPTSPEEACVAPLLARSNLLITRDIEWANLVLGFEQENRYAIVDVCYPQAPVGYIREQSNIIARQLLRLRRPFVASITDGMGNELFRVRRPFWWITSSIYAEIDGQEVGVVHRRWHLWRRIYDLYLGDKQFAVVENPGLWYWTFTLKDIDGKVLAEIDRDWRGFGFELFTDAGQYVIRFGSSDPISKSGPAGAIKELEVARPLTLLERAVVVALAISLDNDYFSRHGGWGMPFVAVGE